jgi:hypothetical protein
MVQETSWHTKAEKYFKNLKRLASQLLPSFPTRFPRFPGIPEFQRFLSFPRFWVLQ